MNDVKMPIKTIKEGNKITKVCVEDVYRLMNRIIDIMDKTHNDAVDIIDSVNKTVEEYEGSLIVGTGISQPCLTDAFDEEIGNNIAFMKAKLNANIKKRNILCRIYNNYAKALEKLDDEFTKIDFYIKMDLNNLRVYNPDYLSDLEEKIGL